MTSRHDEGPAAAHTEAYRLARLLRHEVGDLLQSVYSAAAVLLDRLPGELALERRLLADLRQRAEVCRYELDAALDLVSPAPAACVLDLGEAVAAAAAAVRGRFPALRLSADVGGGAAVRADARALHAAVTMLILALGHNTKEEVRLRLGTGPGRAELELRRGGYPVAPEQLAWLSEPFATTQQALLGLALAQAARLARPGGGEVAVACPAEGGVSVRIVFPVHAAE